MPYLRPEDVLRRFSRFTLSTVRPAVDEDEAFVRGQVGSMASTLRFLAGELEGRDRAVDEQERVLHEALDDVARVVDDGPVARAVRAARERIEDASGAPIHEREQALLVAADEVLGRIDDTLADEEARAARQPLYDFLDTRLAEQHRLMGRRQDGATAGADAEDP